MLTRILLVFLSSFLLTFTARSADILWAQYCQHGDSLKLMVHLDANPEEPSSERVQLWIKNGSDWQRVSEQQMYTLSSSVLFRFDKWPNHQAVDYKVSSGKSELKGVIRAIPADDQPVKMIGVAGLSKEGWPWAKMVQQMIEHDPDLLFFSGDQIFENDRFIPKTSIEVAKGMNDYLEKYRKFGEAFRELLKDRPSILITDDNDVYLNKLWGDGGKKMKKSRFAGGYPCHPNWVNTVELTQMGTLPKAHLKGPHGDGIFAYYTSIEYGGVRLAVLEDRKFKSPPSEVLKHRGLKSEVITDSTFDCRTLDRADLNLLGKEQEMFLSHWSAELKQSGKVGAVLSQSPWVHIAMSSQKPVDLDSNGWPQSGRNRALKAIGDAPVVMIHGDVQPGMLFKHGVNQWEDGPLSFSLPPLGAQTGKLQTPQNTGRVHDRFGNKMTVHATANGVSGFGMITFDPAKKTVDLEFQSVTETREPVVGWPLKVSF